MSPRRAIVPAVLARVSGRPAGCGLRAARPQVPWPGLSALIDTTLTTILCAADTGSGR
jgi:hypothetical protein